MSNTTENKSHVLEVEEQPGKSRERVITEVAASGLCTNALLVTNFSSGSFGELSLMDCIHTLKAKAHEVNNGNIGELERMLTAQAVSLDTIFSSMALRAKMNLGQYPDAVNKYMNLALRAQSQCRATVETLAEIKNPRPYIQNNKAHYQQVNNGVPPPQDVTSRARENPKSSNELLEYTRHEQQWLDTGASSEAVQSHSEMETVET